MKEHVLQWKGPGRRPPAFSFDRRGVRSVPNRTPAANKEKVS